MSKAVLVRVGIDSGYGYNAPVNPVTCEFAYVPIPEDDPRLVNPDCRTTYEEFKEPWKRFGCPFPSKLIQKYPSVHLDPDFSELTYGDIDEINGKNHRGKPLLDLQEDDLLVFYAGLDPGRWRDRKLELVQAIIGLYVIKTQPERAPKIPNIAEIKNKNAHTRRGIREEDIIVFAKPPPCSGRLTKCIPIGERRSNGKYYLKKYLFDEWGGFQNRDSLWLAYGLLPKFSNAEKFYDWFKEELRKGQIQLVKKNNLE